MYVASLLIINVHSRGKITQTKRRVDKRKGAIVAEARDVDDLSTIITTTITTIITITTTEGLMWSHHLHLIRSTTNTQLLENSLQGPACQMAPEDFPWAGGSLSVLLSKQAYHKDLIKGTNRYVIVDGME